MTRATGSLELRGGATRMTEVGCKEAQETWAQEHVTIHPTKVQLNVKMFTNLGTRARYNPPYKGPAQCALGKPPRHIYWPMIGPHSSHTRVAITWGVWHLLGLYAWCMQA